MRFKFTCSCGKRLAAYSWMAGKMVECPRCSKTLTIPTPERAAELQSARGETFVSPYSRRVPDSRGRRVSRWLLALLVLTVFAAAGMALYIYVLGP